MYLAIGSTRQEESPIVSPSGSGLGKSKPSRGSSSQPAAGSAVCVMFSLSAYRSSFLVVLSKGVGELCGCCLLKQVGPAAVIKAKLCAPCQPIAFPTFLQTAPCGPGFLCNVRWRQGKTHLDSETRHKKGITLVPLLSSRRLSTII